MSQPPMDIKRLPYLPLHFFYHQLSTDNRRMFLVLMGLLLAAAGFFLFSYVYPEFWALQITEVSETSTEKVLVTTLHQNYRSFDINLNAFRQWVSYSASPLLPQALPVVLFWFFQAVAWSLMLTVASSLKGRWPFFLFFICALFIHFSGVIPALLPQGGWAAFGLEFGVVIVFLGFGYLFMSHTLRWSLPARWGLFLGLMLILFSLPLLLSGWLTLHQMSIDAFVWLLLLSVLYLFFIGKEPTNLIILLSTNRPEPSARLGIGWVAAVVFLYLLTGFLWMNEFLRFGLPVMDIGLRPGHLVFISAIFTVFTSQNQYHQVKNIFGSLAGFTYFLIAGSLAIVSFLFVNFASGDQIFIIAIEQIAAVFFFSIGIGHTLFIFINHSELLKAKVNFYYLMTQGRSLSLYTVWLIGLVALISAEGRENWASINLAYQTHANNTGDQALLKGDTEAAANAYEVAIGQSKFSPKANYNLASLYLSDRNKLAIAVGYYQDATRSFEFAPARLNAANLFYLNYQVTEAKNILKKGLSARDISPYVANNLALMYVKEKQPDSAIMVLKQGLLADLHLSGLYSNLGLIYFDNQRTEDAIRFMKAARDAGGNGEVARVNSLMLAMKMPEIPDFQLEEDILSENYFLSYNHLLWQMRQQGNNINRKKLKTLADQDQSPDAMLLDGYLMFEEDSTEYALSRMKYLQRSYPDYAAQAHYLIGVGYFHKGAPEMARKYFLAQAEAGDLWGELYAAKMNIDLGNADSASLQLSMLRAKDQALWEPCGRELAMLLKAYGQDLYAGTEWDLSTLTFDEKVRIGIYADSMNQYINALEGFRAVQAMDSGSIVPYLELGRIYNKYADSLAIETLNFGLAVNPESIELNLELARAWLLAGKPEKSAKILNKYTDNLQYADEILFLRAQQSLIQKDTSAAITILDSLHQKEPLNAKYILPLASVYAARGEYEQGNVLISTAINLNDANGELWYYYAVFSRAWNLPEDAGFGAVKAIELSRSPQRKKEIAADFAEEIRLISQN
ncbi:MAG: hypothetical protein SF052_03130 [Bacteroidia bacterium]|nr:hypothetical protein [Bacteroidia bacterium]